MTTLYSITHANNILMLHSNSGSIQTLHIVQNNIVSKTIIVSVEIMTVIVTSPIAYTEMLFGVVECS